MRTARCTAIPFLFLPEDCTWYPPAEDGRRMPSGHGSGDDGLSEDGSREENNPLLLLIRGIPEWPVSYTHLKYLHQ